MSERPFIVRRLSETDAEAFRAIRLEALEQSPEAFGSTYEKESVKPIEWFRDRLNRNVILGGFVAGRLMGTVGGTVGFSGPMDGQKIAHKGVMGAMYVQPEARGTGLAGALVQTLIELARWQVEQIQLTVIVDNPRARSLYERMGFTEYGYEKNALKYNGVYFDEVLTVRFLQT